MVSLFRWWEGWEQKEIDNNKIVNMTPVPLHIRSCEVNKPVWYTRQLTLIRLNDFANISIFHDIVHWYYD